MNPRLLWNCARIATLLPALAFLAAATANAQDVPPPAAEVVDYTVLLPLLTDGPAGWTADKAEGSTEDVGGFKITNVHRDYKKGEADNGPTTSISILDSAANPEYVEATTAAWNSNAETMEGYTKSVTIDGLPGFETFENEGKHGTLWVMVAKRYFLQIETRGQEAKELREWLKRIDLKKLAEIK